VPGLAGVANGVTACRRTRSSHIAMADMTTPTDRSPPAYRICGGTAIADARDALECRECGSVMVRIVPSAEELTAFYATYNDTYSGGGGSGGRNQIRYAEAYLGLVRRFTTGGSILDVGCANNPFVNLAAQRGFRVAAADFTRPPHLSADVTFRFGHLNDRGWVAEADAYDTVTAWAVIEHARDPALACEVLAALTKPGGHVFMTTPEVGTVLTRWAAGGTPWFYPPEHLHLLSPRAIERLAGRHGLELVRWGHFELSPLRWLARYGIGGLEALSGAVRRSLTPARWLGYRRTRRQRFVGIAYYVLRKRGI
jgi:hypothetical protein